jgi:hypothetical protein
MENGKLKIEKVASKREQRVLAHLAEREQLKATKGGLIKVRLWRRLLFSFQLFLPF